jgi:LacI family transcriptional regulator
MSGNTAKTKKTVAIAFGRTGQGLDIASSLIANGIMRHAAEQGWDVVDLRSWHWNIPRKADGLIYERHINQPDVIARIRRDIPHNVELQPERNLAAARGVVTDMEVLGRKAAEYYLERGFRNFALASYIANEWTESLKAFKTRIEKSGGTCQAVEGLHLPDDVLLTEIRDAVRAQLRKLDYPLGIFCVNDRLAFRLCAWCIEEGIAVPEQAAILGFGNDSIACQSSQVPLSSISPDYERHGVEAARLLQRMMDGKNVPPGTVIRVPPLEIITRRSTDITAIQDTKAALALRYIWDHYRKPISPKDVAAFCGIPRRSLERRFKKALGRTIMKEVMRQRLSKAGELLASGEIPAVDIAAYVGFGTPQYFNFQFKKKVGLPPQAYRDRERKSAR